jgi:hypothetical protein
VLMKIQKIVEKNTINQPTVNCFTVLGRVAV